jgi:hypothetical protein
MAESLTNAILVAILHLIWQDLTGNPPCGAPLCQAPSRRRTPHRAPRVLTTTPSYRLMELSPPRSSMSSLTPFGTPYTPNMGSIDLGRLTGPLEGITPFTAAISSWWTPGMSQEEEASGVPTSNTRRGS